MNSKLAAALKMLVLSVGIIAVFAVVSDGFHRMDNSGGNKSLVQYDFAMGTSVSVSLYGNNDLEKTYAAVIDEINTLDHTISWRLPDGELGHLNEDYSASEEYEISSELYNILEQSLDVCMESEGALDITIRPLACVWNIEASDEESFRVPDVSEIRAALCNVDYRKISLSGGASENKYSIIIDSDDMIIDLGSVGKGYALDCVESILEQEEVSGAAVSVGGSILIYGSKPDMTDWKIGIRNPDGDIDDMIGYLTFSKGTRVCISTSGDYEKYCMYDGVRYHHILDSHTGYPSDSGLSGVTVVCENGLLSDALSTACFVLGYDRSLPLLKKYGADAIFIDTDNKVTVTNGLKDRFSMR